MDSFEKFKHELQDALMHLYDPSYQPTDHVYTALGCKPEEGPAVVQSALIQLIKRLEPDPSAPSSDRIRQDFEVLNQRFVLELTQEKTAERLNFSVRSVQRIQQRAVYRLARRIWEQRSADGPLPDNMLQKERQQSSGATPSDDTFPDWHSQVQQELTFLQQSTPGITADVGETMGKVVKLGQALASKHNITLQVEPTLPGLLAVIHPSALRQVLITAIEKLAQHMSTGEITLSAERIENFIKIAITGHPVEADHPPHSDLMQEILTTQNGSVEIDLSEDRIFFQVELLSAEKEVIVLVVDDNPDLVKFFRHYVTDTRYHIVHLAEGKRLLDLIADLTPDIVMLDVMLPDVDGWELLTYLHEHPATRMIPVIVCSVVRREELAFALGAAHYLPKPVRRQQFIQALDQVLDMARAKVVRNEENNATTD